MFFVYVFPGGGVEEGESLEQAINREIKEETGFELLPNPARWTRPRLIELDGRIVLFADGIVKNFYDPPVTSSDLYDAEWFSTWNWPKDFSPALQAVYSSILKAKEDNDLTASAKYTDW